MTALTVRRLHCDGATDGTPCREYVDSASAGSFFLLRHDAKGRQWRTRGHGDTAIDLCPTHCAAVTA